MTAAETRALGALLEAAGEVLGATGAATPTLAALRERLDTARTALLQEAGLPDPLDSD